MVTSQGNTSEIKGGNPFVLTLAEMHDRQDNLIAIAKENLLQQGHLRSIMFYLIDGNDGYTPGCLGPTLVASEPPTNSLGATDSVICIPLYNHCDWLIDNLIGLEVFGKERTEILTSIGSKTAMPKARRSQIIFDSLKKLMNGGDFFEKDLQAMILREIANRLKPYCVIKMDEGWALYSCLGLATPKTLANHPERIEAILSVLEARGSSRGVVTPILRGEHGNEKSPVVGFGKPQINEGHHEGRFSGLLGDTGLPH